MQSDEKLQKILNLLKELIRLLEADKVQTLADETPIDPPVTPPGKPGKPGG